MNSSIHRRMIISVFQVGIILLFVSIGCKESTVNTDDIDTAVVTIGQQVWMKKNLDISVYRNGDSIPHAITPKEWMDASMKGEGAWCYFDNDPANGKTYGKLYNWFAVNDARGLAPSGFHIPSDTEWTIVTAFLGGEAVAGNTMKNTSGWYNRGNGTNTSNFSGLPGGIRSGNGTFDGIGSNGYWWSSTEQGTTIAWFRYLYFNSGLVNRNYDYKNLGISVRCLRD